MEQTTLDQLIEKLQSLKASGVPGDRPMVLAAIDNNGRYGVANFDLGLHQVAVAKADYDKGWTLAKVVTRGGVPVVMLS